MADIAPLQTPTNEAEINTDTVQGIYETHPHAFILTEALDAAPGEATADEFKAGFHAALEAVRLQGAKVLADYMPKVQIPEGATVSFESQEVNGIFEQRTVIRGRWAAVEKPSALR